MLRRVRLLLWLLVAVALGIAALLVLEAPTPGPATPSTSVANIGGPFTLTDANSQKFGTTQLAGRPYALFFGFTHCPDVCPTTLARLTNLRHRLGPDDKAFDIVFVSVDPERDTPAELKRYASVFPTPVTMLTGSVAEIDRVKKLFGVFSEKVPLKDGSYTVDHSAQVLLFDRGGQFAGTISREEGDDVALAKLKRIGG